MEFNFSKRPISEWLELLVEAKRTNWLQSLPYAKVSALRDRKTTRLATLHHEGKMVGLVAIQEIKLGPLHTVDIYRGPLWFCKNPPLNWLEEFAVLFAKTFPKRPLRRRRWLPEWKDSPEVRAALEKAGFQSTTETYETAWIDLDKSEAAIRAQFASKWRNRLNKAEGLKLDIRLDMTGTSTDLFLAHYQLHLIEKTYNARDMHFVREEIEVAAQFKNMLMFWAYEGEDAIASILVMTHGTSGSFRIGWTTPRGKECQAHSLLLWEAIRFLKLKGFDSFDLGGMTPFSSTGIDHFKKGLRGEEFKTPGLFR